MPKAYHVIAFKERNVGPSTLPSKYVEIKYPDMTFKFHGKFTLNQLKKIVEDGEEFLKEQE